MAGDSTSLTFKLFGQDVSASKAIEGVGKKAAGVGEHVKTGLAAGAAAGGAMLVAGLMQGLETEKVTDKMNAQLGKTGPEAARLGKVAGDLWADNFGAGPEDAANALRMSLQGGLFDEKATDAEMKAITGSVMNLATTFDLDLGGTVNAVSQMMKTGMAKNSKEALDILTVGFQGGADKAGDFLDTINEYGTQFRKLGLDGATATALISQGLKAGARDADIVADSLKEFSIRAVDGSKLTSEGFKSIGLNAGTMAKAIGAGGETAEKALGLTLEKLRAMPDPVKRSQTAVALFGTQAEDLGEALFALDTTKAQNEIKNVGGAADRMGTTLNDNTGAKIETFKRETLVKFQQIAAGIISFAQENQSWLVPLLVVLGSFAAVIGTIVAAVKVARAVMIAWTAVQWLFNIAMTANPIGLVILAIVALVAAIVIAYKKSETFRNIVQGAMRGAVTAWNWVWKKVGGFVGWIKSNWPRLLPILTGPIGLAVRWIVTNWGKIISMFKTAPGKIAGIAKGMWTGLVSSFKGALNSIIGGWNRLSFSVPSIDMGPLGSVGGFTIGTPDIPYLAKGGIVSKPTLAMIGEAGPEAVVPLGRGGFGQGVTVNVYAGAVGNEDFLAREVTRALKGAKAKGLMFGTV